MKKKIVMMSCLFMTLLVLTGCGSKKLVCTLTEEGSSLKAVTEFKDKKAVTTTVETTEEAASEEEAKQLKETYDAMLGLMTDESVTMEVKVNGKKVTLIATLNIGKMTDEDLQEEFNGDISYDAMKKYYEADGYTCN